jgi:hypothetical protein
MEEINKTIVLRTKRLSNLLQIRLKCRQMKLFAIKLELLTLNQKIKLVLKSFKLISDL